MMKIDAFSHLITSHFYQQMLALAPEIPERFSFIKIPALLDLKTRLATWPDSDLRQIVAFANLSPEDFTDPDQASQLASAANQELAATVAQHQHHFAAGVGMLAMNNVPASLQILQQIKQNKYLVGAQIFTRHLGKSIADPAFDPIFAQAAKLQLPLWLHPVFDSRKPDNNLVFSWEYELSQAMLQLVQADIFTKYPHLQIIVHHAGAMVPFFAGRINHILDSEHAAMFKKFYVDTAILGNSAALQLAIDYFGLDHVLFGTDDAPFAVMPAGANQIIVQAINALDLSTDQKDQIFSQNLQQLLPSQD